LWSTTGAEFIPADDNRGFTLIEVMVALVILLMIIMTWGRVFITAGTVQERLEKQMNFFNQGTILGHEIIASMAGDAVVPPCCQELTVEELKYYNFTFSQALNLEALQEVKIYFTINQFFVNQGRIYQVKIIWKRENLDFFFWKII